MKLKTVLSVLLLLCVTGSAFADVKTVSVQVSCTIPAMMELASPIAQAVTARSNLSNQYQMTEDYGHREGKNVKLYSLTAL